MNTQTESRVDRLRRLYNRAYWMQRRDPSFDRDMRRISLLLAHRDACKAERDDVFTRWVREHAIARGDLA